VIINACQNLTLSTSSGLTMKLHSSINRKVTPSLHFSVRTLFGGGQKGHIARIKSYSNTS